MQNDLRRIHEEKYPQRHVIENGVRIQWT
jgi:hypothetical protein